MQTMPNNMVTVSVRAARTGDIGTFNAFDMPVKVIFIFKILIKALLNL